MFILNAKFSTFLLSLNLSISHLIFLQCLSKFVVLLYYCLMLLEKCSTCISFLLITLFIPHLNSFINTLLSYLLFFTALLNFCTNSSIVLLLCSTFFNSATFIISLSPPSNSFFRFIRRINSSTIANSKLLFFRFLITFFFKMSTNSLYMYDITYWVFFSTKTFLIFILIYNLYTIKKPKILLISPLNVGGLATSTFNLVLGLEVSYPILVTSR